MHNISQYNLNIIICIDQTICGDGGGGGGGDGDDDDDLVGTVSDSNGAFKEIHFCLADYIVYGPLQFAQALLQNWIQIKG